MPVILLARIRVRPGAEAAFEAAVGELYAAMRLHESGCRANVMHRSLGGPAAHDEFAGAGQAGAYVFHEVYETEADGRAHPQTPTSPPS